MIALPAQCTLQTSIVKPCQCHNSIEAIENGGPVQSSSASQILPRKPRGNQRTIVLTQQSAILFPKRRLIPAHIYSITIYIGLLHCQNDCVVCPGSYGLDKQLVAIVRDRSRYTPLFPSLSTLNIAFKLLLTHITIIKPLEIVTYSI